MQGNVYSESRLKGKKAKSMETTNYRLYKVSTTIMLITALVACAGNNNEAGLSQEQHSVSNSRNIKIISDELWDSEKEKYCVYAMSEREKVEAFWGATWKEPIRIHVDSRYRISRALIPSLLGNRGYMEMPLRRVDKNNGALLHEIVHIYAPNDNRFLAEGLAVYLQETYGGNPGFPNLDGKNFQALAKKSQTKIASLHQYSIARTMSSRDLVKGNATFYILAGSFVGFLIEGYGLDKFKQLYDSSDYTLVYEKSLDVLEKEWRSNFE